MSAAAPRWCATRSAASFLITFNSFLAQRRIIRLVKKHGVVVVHGQGEGLLPGDHMAEVINGIADTIEIARGTVSRSFSVVGDTAIGLLVVTPPGALEPQDEFHFAEGYWAKALPPAPPEVVVKWMLRRGFREALAVIRGFWGNLANDQIDDTPGARSKYPARLWLKATFAIELLFLTALIWLLVALSWLLAPLIYALYSIAGVSRSQAAGFLAPAARAVHSLDPFFGETMGDTWRFVEDGMWSANIRACIERPIVAFYADPSIVDITVIAHSAGCGVTYDALARGRAVGDAAAVAAPAKRLTFATAGSAVNRFFALSAAGTSSPNARRLSVEPFDSRITGTPKEGPVTPAETDDARTALRNRFYWLDIYARMDLVPGGGVLDEVVRTARIDPCQLKRRPVINEDSLLRDHHGYFNNTDLVTPRIIRAIYGGEYPWDGATREQSPRITPDRIAHRTRRVAALQAVRMAAFALIVAYVVFFFAVQRFRDWAARDAGAVVNVDLGQLGEFITLAIVLVAPVLLVYSLYQFVRGWWLSDS